MPKPVTALFAAQPAAGMPLHVATRSIFADPTIDELRTRGFVDFCSAQEMGKSLVHGLQKRPVGGAPSRSGFLATPTDASPRPTFSRVLRIPGEEMPCTASNRTSRASRLSKGLEHAETTREMNVDRSPTRSGLGSATRNCRRKSPPGSEAVRGVEARAHHACKQHHPASAEPSPDRFHGPARTRAHESTESS
jgi:hypothetical protein